VLILFVGLPGCHNPCRELERKIGLPGWKAKESMLDCRRELRTLEEVAPPFGSVEKWRFETVGKEAQIFFSLQDAIIKADVSVPLQGFARWPAKVPCSDGFKISPEAWASSPLASWYPTRLALVRSSFELAISGPADEPIMTLRGWEDFNCDGVLGMLESVGRIDRKRHLFFQTSYRSPQRITE
jgi:hypothetical protein